MDLGTPREGPGRRPILRVLAPGLLNSLIESDKKICAYVYSEYCMKESREKKIKQMIAKSGFRWEITLLNKRLTVAVT